MYWATPRRRFTFSTSVGAGTPRIAWTLASSLIDFYAISCYSVPWEIISIGQVCGLSSFGIMFLSVHLFSVSVSYCWLSLWASASVVPHPQQILHHHSWAKISRLRLKAKRDSRPHLTTKWGNHHSQFTGGFIKLNVVIRLFHLRIVELWKYTGAIYHWLCYNSHLTDPFSRFGHWNEHTFIPKPI